MGTGKVIAVFPWKNGLDSHKYSKIWMTPVFGVSSSSEYTTGMPFYPFTKNGEFKNIQKYTMTGSSHLN